MDAHKWLSWATYALGYSLGHVRGWRRGHQVASAGKRRLSAWVPAILFVAGAFWYAAGIGVFWAAVEVYSQGARLALQNTAVGPEPEVRVISQGEAWQKVRGKGR